VFRARARARESGICKAGEKGDVPVCRAPLTVEFFFDEAMDFHFRHTASAQPRNRSAPLINFALTAFVVGVTLAGADGWLFDWFHV
jgi:hypothetical protein